MSSNITQQCNLYATEPQLAEVKSKYDLMLNSIYCPQAMSQPYGPNFSSSLKINNNKICPFKPLSTPSIRTSSANIFKFSHLSATALTARSAD